MDRRKVMGALAGVSMASVALGQNQAGDVRIPTYDGYRDLKGKEAAAYHAINKWLEARMKEAQSIGVGSTFADVVKVFRGDGGLSTVTKHRFVLILCPYVKVDMEFETAKGGKAKYPLPAEAKVVSVSKPYFEHEFLD